MYEKVVSSARKLLIGLLFISLCFVVLLIFTSGLNWLIETSLQNTGTQVVTLVVSVLLLGIYSHRIGSMVLGS